MRDFYLRAANGRAYKVVAEDERQARLRLGQMLQAGTRSSPARPEARVAPRSPTPSRPPMHVPPPASTRPRPDLSQGYAFVAPRMST